MLACVVLAVAAVAAPAAAGASGERRGFDYDVPVLSDSPWPEMRRDGRNTAMSPIRARYRGDRAMVVADRPRGLLDPGDRR